MPPWSPFLSALEARLKDLGNKSRNEQQKAVFLIEVAKTSHVPELFNESRRLINESRKLRETVHQHRAKKTGSVAFGGRL